MKTTNNRIVGKGQSLTKDASRALLDQLTAQVEANPSLAQSLRLKWTRFIPTIPTPKQRAFLLLPHMEALYGGAAGGG